MENELFWGDFGRFFRAAADEFEGFFTKERT